MARPAIKAKIGKDFLPNTTTAYLKLCHKKDPRARDRLSAYAQRKDGKIVGEIAANVNRHRSTIHK